MIFIVVIGGIGSTEGPMGFLQQRFDLELFPVRRRLPTHLMGAAPVTVEQSGVLKEPV